MNAAEVKDALRARHPALDQFGGPGPWTCVEEWMNIDLLAVSAWSSVRPYPQYARVGYEVKVSRSDYKRELARPYKRAAAVRFCHEFYFAVPAGLLTPYEEGWKPPAGFAAEDAPFERPRCPGAYGYDCAFGRARRRGMYGRSGEFDHARYRNDQRIDAACPTCRGTGWIVDSPATRAAAPKLWVPADVGLVVVHPSGRVTVARKAPKRDPKSRTAALALAGRIADGRRRDGIEMTDLDFGQLVRWISFRPDPRHARRS